MPHPIPMPVPQLMVQRLALGQSAGWIARCLGLVPRTVWRLVQRLRLRGPNALATSYPSRPYRQDGVRLGGSLAWGVAVSGRARQPRADAAGRATVPRTDRELDGQRPSPAVRAVKPCVGIKRSNWVSGLSGQPWCRLTGTLDTGPDVKNTGPLPLGVACQLAGLADWPARSWSEPLGPWLDSPTPSSGLRRGLSPDAHAAGIS